MKKLYFYNWTKNVGFKTKYALFELIRYCLKIILKCKKVK